LHDPASAGAADFFSAENNHIAGLDAIAEMLLQL
jgi:hypothetical protein